ncbi:arginine-tRNA-protein transferase [Cubamyces lactineus]|nr:arginine-tRNA-protein transferase [Cubamyces lactineus]
MSNEPLSILAPLRPHNSTCGYCGPPGQRSEEETNYHRAEGLALQLSCRVYQKMIDRGWRRSGTYCYKPDLKRSCCPQYTIKFCSDFTRLDALQFKPSKSQRKLLNRFNRFVIHGDHRDADDPKEETSKEQSRSDRSKGKGKATHVFNLVDDIHAAESSFVRDTTPAHRFEVTLEPSSYTDEKFALYCSYQKEIHKEDDKRASSFRRFLVQTPLIPQTIEYAGEQRPAHLPEKYGSYHQLYRLDGELIAMGVIDILPNCVSSVYFMYEKKWEKFSLGKLSALREASLAREIHEAGVPDMQCLYMGFYVHSCPKMRYKGDYAPSYLADPEENTWHPLERCRPLLEQNHYACFAHPEHSLKSPASTADPTPELPPELLSVTRYIADIEGNKVTVAPVVLADDRNAPGMQETILVTLAALGEKLAREVLLDLSYVEL